MFNNYPTNIYIVGNGYIGQEIYKELYNYGWRHNNKFNIVKESTICHLPLKISQDDIIIFASSKDETQFWYEQNANQLDKPLIIDFTGYFKDRYIEYINRLHVGTPFDYDCTYMTHLLIEKKQLDYIIVPGCITLATIRLLEPLLKNNILTEDIIVHARLGHSGAGIHATPPRQSDFKHVFTHYHQDEIKMIAKYRYKYKGKINLVPSLEPWERGIIAYTTFKSNIDINKVYKDIPNIEITSSNDNWFVSYRGENIADPVSLAMQAITDYYHQLDDINYDIQCSKVGL